MNRTAPRCHSGFILVEALVALLLLAVGVLSVAAATATVARQTEVAHARHKLATRLQNEMESRMARPFDPASGGASGTGGASGDSALGYRLQWDVLLGERRQLRLVASVRWRYALTSDTLVMLLPR